MRFERPALELRMELDADEPWMIRPLDDLGQLVVRRHARKYQPGLLQRVAIMDIDFVAVPVAFADLVATVDRPDYAVAVQLGRIGAEPHGAAEVTAGCALLQTFLTHPLGDHADHRLRRVTELGRR